MRATLNNHWLVVFLFNMKKLFSGEWEKCMSLSTEGSQWLWGEVGGKTAMAPYLPCTGLQCQLQVNLAWECTVTDWCSLQCSPFTSPQSQLNSEMTVTPLYFDTIPFWGNHTTDISPSQEWASFWQASTQMTNHQKDWLKREARFLSKSEYFNCTRTVLLCLCFL